MSLLTDNSQPQLRAVEKKQLYAGLWIIIFGSSPAGPRPRSSRSTASPSGPTMNLVSAVTTIDIPGTIPSTGIYQSFSVCQPRLRSHQSMADR